MPKITMKNPSCALLLLLLGLLLPLSALAEDTLDSLVAEALAKNPELIAAKERAVQYFHKEAQSGSLSDPVFGFAFSSYPVDTLDSDQTPMTGNELRLSQMFPFPGKLSTRAALAREQAEWFDAVYRDGRHQLARKVKDVWLRIYFQERAIEVTERSKALLDDVIRLAEVRYETGMGLQQDVLKAQVERAKLVERLLTQTQMRDSARAELNRLVDRPVDSAVEIPNVYEPQADVPGVEAFYASAANRPMKDAYRSLVDRFRQQQRLAELDSYPDVTLWASWRFRDDSLMDGGTDFVSAGFSMNLPIYRERRRAAEAEADAAVRMAQRQSREFDNSLSQAIHNAYAKMTEAGEQSSLYREGIIPLASQGFQAALSAYQVGKVEFISLLDALMSTYRAELDYYRAHTEYLRSLAWLEAESTRPVLGAELPPDTIAQTLQRNP